MELLLLYPILHKGRIEILYLSRVEPKQVQVLRETQTMRAGATECVELDEGQELLREERILDKSIDGALPGRQFSRVDLADSILEGENLIVVNLVTLQVGMV